MLFKCVYITEDNYGKGIRYGGLGRFGGSIVRELNALDMDVMAIDSDENRVNEYSDIATHAVVADTTDGNSNEKFRYKKL